MIYYIRGILSEYTEEGIVVEAGGVGYSLIVPTTVLSELPSPGEEVRLYTYFQVAEDMQKLYGFLTREERETFLLLIKVNGIGPKLAVSVLSAISVEELRIAVITGDVKTLSRAPGLGKKTAEKMILELKDKFDAAKVVEAVAGKSGDAPVVVTDAFTEAVAALQSLGYSSSEALKAVRAVPAEDDWTVDEILQAAFQKLALF
ncbi:MAG: Holliday junction branch migration protein RuvA [Lachnospiraceae bacterium]|nr:Holliday junction branch migration protein RuvA [Lachnospiraceae bacterium]